MTTKTSGPATGERRGEVRLPAAVAMAVAIALYTLLPQELLFGPRLLVPVIAGLLLIPLIAANPTRMTRENRWLRLIALALVGLLIVLNTVSLGIFVTQLINGTGGKGKTLLVAAMQIWLTNVLAYALAYWELDRGGPVARRLREREALDSADFRFPQDENHDAIGEVAAGSSKVSGWLPGFLDYLYVSITNSSAFSPTDTMPLTARSKILMSLESISALLTALLLLARAVNSLQ